MSEKFTLTHVGTYWPWGGDLFYMTNAEGHEARVYVDSIGETWVRICRIPEGGWFASEKIEAYRALNGALHAERELAERGFAGKKWAYAADRVRERTL